MTTQHADESGAGGVAQDAVDSLGGSERATNIFRLTYRLIEDLQRVRLAHGNRIRQVLPQIPASVDPPRGAESWETFFATSAEALEAEEARLLRLARSVLRAERTGRWLLAQQGIGPALALSILGECWPIGTRTRPSQLWGYAGLDVTDGGFGVCRRRPRQTTDGPSFRWNWRLKMRLWVFANSALKSRGTWRDCYDHRKVYELERLRAHLSADDHKEREPESFDLPAAHVRIDDHEKSERGPNYSPRLHAHNRALRYTAKMLLKDLWRVDRGLPPLIGVDVGD